MGNNVELRKLRMSDVDKISKLFTNKNVLRYLAFTKRPAQITKKKEQEWLKKVLKQYKKRKPELLDLAIIANGELIGSIGFHKADYKNQKAIIGYWIGEPYWGKGYTPEAIKQFSKFIIKKFKFRRLEAGIYHPNKASQRAIEKAGFKFEGTKRKSIKKGNQIFDEKIWALVK